MSKWNEWNGKWTFVFRCWVRFGITSLQAQAAKGIRRGGASSRGLCCLPNHSTNKFGETTSRLESLVHWQILHFKEKEKKTKKYLLKADTAREHTKAALRRQGDDSLVRIVCNEFDSSASSLFPCLAGGEARVLIDSMMNNRIASSADR